MSELPSELPPPVPSEASEPYIADATLPPLPDLSDAVAFEEHRQAAEAQLYETTARVAEELAITRQELEIAKAALERAQLDLAIEQERRRYTAEVAKQTQIDLAVEQIRRRRANELAMTDQMTGLPHQTAFLRRLRQVTAESRRYNDPTYSSLAFVDLDHFKAINDLAGHSAGDKVLKRFAEALKEETRDSDLLGRVGGEEFCVYLKGSRIEDAAQFVERLRMRMADIERPGGAYKDSEAYLTASFGIVELREPVPDSDAAYRAADKAMYEIKKEGRNGAAYFKVNEATPDKGLKLKRVDPPSDLPQVSPGRRSEAR